MSVQEVLTQLTTWTATAHLDQCLVFQGDLAIVADFPEGGSKAPFVCGHAQVLAVFHTLRSNPRDSFYALWKKTTDIYRSVSGIMWEVNHCHCSKSHELLKKLFQTVFPKQRPWLHWSHG